MTLEKYRLKVGEAAHAMKAEVIQATGDYLSIVLDDQKVVGWRDRLWRCAIGGRRATIREGARSEQTARIARTSAVAVGQRKFDVLNIPIEGSRSRRRVPYTGSVQ